MHCIVEAVEKRQLTPCASSSGTAQALEDQIRGGGLPRTEALVILSTAAGAGQEYRIQLDNVLSWLQYVGLVRLDEKFVRPGEVIQPVAGDGSSTGEATDVLDELTGGHDMEPTKSKEPERKDVVLAFNLDFRLSASELASLSPEQIKALFEAVGTVAALTAPR
jgi:hypothetical protein